MQHAHKKGSSYLIMVDLLSESFEGVLSAWHFFKCFYEDGDGHVVVQMSVYIYIQIIYTYNYIMYVIDPNVFTYHIYILYMLDI